MTARVGMDLLWCVPGVGGSEDYLVRQLLGLAELNIEEDVSVVVFAPRGFAEAHPDVASRFRVVEAPSRCVSRVVRVVLQHTWLAFKTRRCDVVHCGGGTLPRTIRRRSVLTIHDIQWVDYPHYVHPIKRWYLRRSVPASAARATMVAVPSEFVRRTLISCLGTDPDKVVAVPHGVEHTLAAEASTAADLRSKFSLGPGPVVVYPAQTHPHKNHVFLLKLMADNVGDWADPNLRLVVTGNPARADADVRDFIARNGLSDRVRMLGRVRASERDGLVAMADAVVFPSEYEGFGAPLIEAMAIGTPVVCSDRGSLPEVAGNAAIVCALDERAWAHALTEVRARREELVARGKERVAEYTARKSAEVLVDVYEKALS